MRTESETDSCHRLRATTTTTRIFYTLIDVTVAAFAFCPCVCVRVFFYFNIFSVYTHRAGFPSSPVNIFSMLHSLQDLLFSFYFIQLHITMKKKVSREREIGKRWKSQLPTPPHLSKFIWFITSDFKFRSPPLLWQKQRQSTYTVRRADRFADETFGLMLNRESGSLHVISSPKSMPSPCQGPYYVNNQPEISPMNRWLNV